MGLRAEPRGCCSVPRPRVRPLLRLPLAPASRSAGTACSSREGWEPVCQGPRPQPHLSPFLPSRHRGLWKGPPHVLGLRGAGGAAVFVGQGKVGGCHIDSLACLSCHLSSWHRGLFLPFLRRPGTPLLFFLLAASVTHLVPEAHLHPSSQVTHPKSRDKLGSFWLRDFAADQNGTR